MEDLLKKVLYAGVGIAATATEKVESTINDLVSKGNLPADEGKKIVDDFVKTSEGKKEEFEGKFKTAVEGVVSRLDFAKQEKVDELEKKIKSLERKIKAAQAK